MMTVRTVGSNDEVVRVNTPPATTRFESPEVSLRDRFQEVFEMGAGGFAFRLEWEARKRLEHWLPTRKLPKATQGAGLCPAFRSDKLTESLFFPRSPLSFPQAFKTNASVVAQARRATRGQVWSFSERFDDYGDPIQWHRDPRTGFVWDKDASWRVALPPGGEGEDCKKIWEVARFPHAYHMTRASFVDPSLAQELAEQLWRQIQSFSASNSAGRGIHWSSGQEIVFRLVAWAFAYTNLLQRTLAPRQRIDKAWSVALYQGTAHVAEHIEFAHRAVYNNHILAEAFLLYWAGGIFTGPEAVSWRNKGYQLLDHHVKKQFYPDGGYIQQSHNYHRVALQIMLWSVLVAKRRGDPHERWLAAVDRSVEFLYAHQDPNSGMLPNYGANDGALPAPLSSCHFSDFRPTLQAASLVCRKQRLYPPGPWDEEAFWLLGSDALATERRPVSRSSRSFAFTGSHVLRDVGDPSSFATFRCGSLRDRFSQIDMLHADLWWQGHNVACDGGSYHYNAYLDWHQHFMGTASHNTVTVNDDNQMLHLRQFKVVYFTKAKTLDFVSGTLIQIVSGEHYGYLRTAQVVHRRSIAMVGQDTWLILDTLGRYSAARSAYRSTQSMDSSTKVRLHWLLGAYDYEILPKDKDDAAICHIALKTPSGPFAFRIFGTADHWSVMAGSERPKRGWLSRHYGAKISCPSIEVTKHLHDGVPWITVASAKPWEVRWDRTGLELVHQGDRVKVHLRDGQWRLKP